MPLKRKQVSFPKKGHTYFSLCSKLPSNDSNCKYHKSATLPPTKNQEQARPHKKSAPTTDSPNTSKTSKNPTQNCREHFNNKSSSVNGHQSLKTSVNKLHKKKASHGHNGFALHDGCEEENPKESNTFKCPTDCKYCQGNLNEIIKGKLAQKSIPHTDCKYCNKNIQNKPAKRVLPHTDCKYCLKSPTNGEEECRTSDDDDTLNSIFSEEIICDELSELDLVNDCTCFACPLHDFHCTREERLQDPHFSHYHNRRYQEPGSSKNACTICENPSSCLVNEDFANTYANIMREQLSCSHALQGNTWKSTNSRSYCEFCLQNGQSAVIYNSHQYRNTFGIITCPIIRKNDVCSGCDEVHGFQHDQMMSALNLKSVPYHGFSIIPNGYDPRSSFALQTNSYSDEPFYNQGVPKNYLSPGNPVYCNNYSHDDLINERFYKTNSANYVPNNLHKYDFQNLFPDPNMYQAHQRGSYGYDDNFFPSKHMQNSKKNVSCQFCLSSGESPLIYNSHKLRDEAGINLRCPILKQQANGVTGSAARACNGYGNPERVPHGPFVQGVSNGLLNKRQYANYLDCLI